MSRASEELFLRSRTKILHGERRSRIDAAHLRPLASYEKKSESASFTVQLGKTDEQEGLLTFLELAIKVGYHRYADSRAKTYLEIAESILGLLEAYISDSAIVLQGFGPLEKERAQTALDKLGERQDIEINRAKMARLIDEATEEYSHKSGVSKENFDLRTIYYYNLGIIRSFSFPGPARLLYDCKEKFYELEQARLKDKLDELERKKDAQRRVEVEISSLTLRYQFNCFHIQWAFDEGGLGVNNIESLERLIQAGNRSVSIILKSYPGLEESDVYKEFRKVSADAEDYLIRMRQKLKKQGMEELIAIVDRDYPRQAKPPDPSLHNATLRAI